MSNKEIQTSTIKSKDFEKIFDVKKQTCNSQTNVSKCAYLERIAYALKYYESLCRGNDNIIGNQIFTEFCKDKYTNMLDDYTHLICKHANNLQEIGEYLKTNYQFKSCNVSECQFIHRHYRNEKITDESKKNIDDYNFYGIKFDTIHLCLMHLQEMGLRFGRSQNNDEKSAFDDILKTQKTYRQTIDRYSNIKNSKFNIMGPKNVDDEKKATDEANVPLSKGNTFTDHMFKYISNNKNIDDIGSRNICEYIYNNEYDTDSIMDDVDNNLNIEHDQDKICVDLIKSAIKYYNVSSNKFSTGIVYFYWDWYKDINDEKYKKDNPTTYNINNFGGYNIRELFVGKHYKSLKDETLSCGFIFMEDYNKKVVDKAEHYYTSERAKAMTCKVADDVLHYRIKFGVPITREHLYAVILYCDFTDFSTDFTSTFRALKWNESITSLKKRNSKFYHISKTLREIVQYYGIRGYKVEDTEDDNDDNDDYEPGPFYTGMSFVMNIPSFAIRLNGPTSTSKCREIAANFAGRNGMIIQLNNEQGTTRGERFCDCSWLSRYPQENERLFAGGRYKLEIQSIRIQSTHNNYKQFFAVFFLFDCMITGDWPPGKSIKLKQIKVLDRAIKIMTGIGSDAMDKYINDTFYLFCMAKTHIILNLYEMDRCIKNKFVELITNPIWEDKDYVKYNKCIDNKNLFKPLLFKLFPNIQEITMYTTYENKQTNNYFSYSFNLSLLCKMLSEDKAASSIKRIIIKATTESQKEIWLQKAQNELKVSAFNFEFKTSNDVLIINL